MSTPIPLILIPGMGADARLFYYQTRGLPNVRVAEWIVPQPRETLRQYAKRLAASVDPGGPCFVGGCSMGGMIAQEMARHLDARACFVISSVRSSTQLPLRARVLRPLTLLLPAALVSVALRLAKFFAQRCGWVLGAVARSAIVQFADTDARFLLWAGEAILTWRPMEGECPCRVIQIHGERDFVIPHRGVTVDILVPRAGHLLPISHPETVNEFLRSQMEQFGQVR
jgi:pimeloyl-ACP methyl ester carboxylesterase